MERHEFLSKHAHQRSQQRGIPIGLIEDILENHDCDAEAGDDCRVLRVSRDAAFEFAIEGGNRQSAERMPSIAIVWSDRTGRVVTVIRDFGKHTSRRYRAGA